MVLHLHNFPILLEAKKSRERKEDIWKWWFTFQNSKTHLSRMRSWNGNTHVLQFTMMRCHVPNRPFLVLGEIHQILDYDMSKFLLRKFFYFNLSEFSSSKWWKIQKLPLVWRYSKFWDHFSYSAQWCEIQKLLSLQAKQIIDD